MSAFEVLRSYGLSPEVDRSHPFKPTREDTDTLVVKDHDPDISRARPDEFVALAKGYLRHLEGVVRNEVIPDFLDDPDVIDRWNPAGHMVFSLGKNSLIGSVRLTMWPQPADRKINLDGPHIHDQAWHSVSLLLGGDYREETYDLLPVAEPDDELPPEKTFTQLRTGHLDVFKENGGYVESRRRGSRIVLPNRVNTVEAGRFIRSIVEQSAVILTVNSHPVRRESTVILPRRDEMVVEQRQAITEHDLEIARSLLADAQ